MAKSGSDGVTGARGDGGPRSYHALIEAARARAAGPVEGLFGPASLAWRVQRELAIVLGGGRALLLQLAHPAVAAGVSQHSDYARDPLGRSQRTFDAVYRVAFADLDGALEAARAVHARHAPVRGTVDATTSSPWSGRAYRAHDPALLFWVLATLIDTSVLLYEALVDDLDDDERDRYYADMRTAALVYGIPPRALPPTWGDFERYMDEMIAGPTLAVGPEARQIFEGLLTQPPSAFFAGLLGPSRWKALTLFADTPRLRERVVDATVLLTAGLLPPQLREGYGLAWSSDDARRRDRLLAAVRGLLPHLPPAIRYSPHYLAAKARLDAADPAHRSGRVDRFRARIERARAGRQAA